MKHASPTALRELQSLIEALRALGTLRERKPGTFYRGSSAFLHFHEDPQGLFADAKVRGKLFRRYRVNSPDERQALLDDVEAELGAAAEMAPKDSDR